MPLLFNSAKSQSDHKTYAVTALNKGGTEWIAIRTLDTRTGEYSPVLLNVTDGSSVAALAYDQKSNRLYYAPMGLDQLRYVDLSTMQSLAVPDQFFSKAGKFDLKNAGPVNRMVIAPDDFGYTITNDGTHLIRFTTHGSPVITDLGDLVDDPENKEKTIHSFCSNSGGDMIADDAGHLLLITGNNNIYTVDIATRLTTSLGRVTGLPAKFTTSGLVVTDDGKQLLVTSVAYTEANYIIDPKTWNATPAPGDFEIIESADLANSNFLITKASGVFLSKSPENQHHVRVFPNPVLEDIVHVQFDDLPLGNYTIQLTDALGTLLLKQKLIISAKAQSATVNVPRKAAQGFYFVRILGERKNVVAVQKLVVERW